VTTHSSPGVGALYGYDKIAKSAIIRLDRVERGFSSIAR
jgi:hypothetical protein|tara:strand:- start:492 stop:608 length:117 start_codon:yes stop_codon:yes gene_type:complete